MQNFQLSKNKLYKPFSNDLDNCNILEIAKKILTPEKELIIHAIIYGIMISLLGLAVPISVQLLINSLAFTALLQPIITLGIILLILLISSGILSAMQFYALEIFQRKFFSRLTAEITLRIVYAKHSDFEASNQIELANRFFDITTIQKTIPKFITKTFAVLLQTIVGLLIIAFYHPFFLAFSIMIALAIYFICFFYAKKAIRASFYESRRKYDVAAWIEDVARSNVIFKSQIGQNYAKYKSDFLTERYLEERQKHFKSLFSQTILLFALYAISSTFLLIIGGALVLKSQLTLGQLVAAELILSAVLYQISRLGVDFESFYDLLSALEKLSIFYNIPLETKSGLIVEDDKINIAFKNVRDEIFGKNYNFNFDFKSNKSYLVATRHSSTQKIIIELIKGLRFTKHGSLEINGKDIVDLDVFNLRSKIGIIDNSDFLEGSVEEYLTFHNQEISKTQINEVLHLTGFDKILSRFNEGLQLRMIPSGWPFSQSEQLLLKTAKILLTHPKVIIVTEAIDMLHLKMRSQIMNYFNKEHNATVICFSNKRDKIIEYDYYQFIDYDEIKNFNTISELEDYEERF